MTKTEEINWDKFAKGFHPEVCRIEGDKLVCEGTLKNKRAVCEIRGNGTGTPEVKCTSAV